MRAKLFLGSLGLLSSLAWGQSPCETVKDAENRFAIGLSLASILPNRLPDFQTSLIAYGPTLGIPVGRDKIQVQAMYGATTGLSMSLAEMNYRFDIPTPFFTSFLLAGGHYLHYSFSGRGHDVWGMNLGLGFTLNMSRNFGLALSMKGYLQDRVMISFGGGFNFLL